MNTLAMARNNVNTSRSQHGLSLVELMVSIAIGMILLIGLANLLANQNHSRDELNKSSRQIDNGRYAMNTMLYDIEHAGYYGGYVVQSTDTYANPNPDPCAGWNLPQPWPTNPNVLPPGIYGYIDPAQSPLSCVPTETATSGGYIPGTTILVVRRMDTTQLTPQSSGGPPTSGANPGDMFLQASHCYSEKTPYVAATTGFVLHQHDCKTLSPVNKYLVRIYYVSSCHQCSGPAADNIPTLMMLENNGSASNGQPIPIAEGIENLQFDFGIDAPPPNSTGAPVAYCPDPGSATGCVGTVSGTNNWLNVMSIRIYLLARNVDCTTGYTDPKTYNMGLANPSVNAAAAVTPGGAPFGTCFNGNGGYKRHLFSATVRLQNPSQRRAQQ